MLIAACYSDQPPRFFSLGPSLEMHSSENLAKSGPSFSSVPFRDPKAARVGYERIAPRFSPALATMVCSLLAESPDPDSSLLLLERLVNETSPETVRLMETHPFLAHYAIAVFGHSWYLGETLIRNPDLLHAFQRERRLDRSHSHEEFSEGLARFRSRSLERDASLILARFKRREYVRIMLRDLLRIAPLAESTAEISALSDVLLQDALREAASLVEKRHGTAQHLDGSGRAVNTAFSVLSLGKLGGNELNYSSDIDVMFLFGDGAEPESASISNREYFVRLAQQVTEILSRPTAEGVVFRIDLRLRPQGNEGELAVNLSRALDYYSQIAHDWERQALIKVRHSAGDEKLAREFIRRVQPQVYSDKINFAAIKTALVTREKIDRKRRRQAAATKDGTIDVKIDRGGIRDIEFLVQCLQRVYGGAEPWLRSGGTLFSLQKLHDKRHISGHDFHELNSAYTFLRHLEHRLQLRQGQQLHRLPSSPHDLEILQRSMAGLIPEYGLTDLVAVVRNRMQAVSEIYQRVIFQQQARESPAPVSDEFSLRSRTEAFSADNSHQQILERLSEDAPQLARALRSTGQGSTVRRNTLRFLSAAFAASEKYAAVIGAQSSIADSLWLFDTSEYLTEILVRHPEEAATLAQIRALPPPPAGASLFTLMDEEQSAGRDAVFAYIANSTASHQEKIALLRRQFRHLAFASGARDLLELRPIYSALAETSSAAEESINAAFGIAGAPSGLAILALGRLGTREFDLLSDADLLFVGDESCDRQALTRAAEEIMQALAAYTQEGLVFPVDARLRPHGGEGELVVTPKQLEQYFSAEAQPWEALMYTKLRFLCGDAALGRRAGSATDVLFRRLAEDHGFSGAVRQMRKKLEDASAPAKSIRTSPGALYDADFISSFLLIKHNMRAKLGTLRDRLWRCAASGALDKKDAAVLDHAGELCRTVEHALRLVIGRNTRWLPAAEHPRQSIEKVTAQILKREFPNGLEHELLATFATVRAIYDRVIR
jgi:[glutamine synthetase] adenylyltransferase / [glutamine synthetase]-adenylyl-L-tyrosine phosphorylase